MTANMIGSSNHFTRKLMTSIEPFLSLREIIVITGMRRVGKSSLLQLIYDKIESTNKTVLDIENPLTGAFLRKRIITISSRITGVFLNP